MPAMLKLKFTKQLRDQPFMLKWSSGKKIFENFLGLVRLHMIPLVSFIKVTSTLSMITWVIHVPQLSTTRLSQLRVEMSAVLMQQSSRMGEQLKNRPQTAGPPIF